MNEPVFLIIGSIVAAAAIVCMAWSTIKFFKGQSR